MALTKKKGHYKLIQSGYQVKYPIFLMPAEGELTEDSYMNFGDEMISFSREVGAHSIEQFCIRWMISVERLKVLAASHPYTAEAYKIMLAGLLVKRIDLVKKGKMPSNIFIGTLHEYSPEYAKWFMDLKKINSSMGKEESFKIVLQKIESSPLVPPIVKEKKSDEK